MKRYRVRYFGSADWTYIEVRGELAAGVAALIEHSFWSWSGTLHAQEYAGGKWENLEL